MNYSFKDSEGSEDLDDILSRNQSFMNQSFGIKWADELEQQEIQQQARKGRKQLRCQSAFFQPLTQQTQPKPFNQLLQKQPRQIQQVQKIQYLKCDTCGQDAMQNHNCEKEFENVNCPHCGENIVRAFMKDHFQECIQYIMSQFKQLEQVEECSICCMDLKSDIQTLKCQHQFHQFCINDWFSKRRECPVCRIQL